MILLGFSIGYWFQRNKNSNTGQTESQTKLKENNKETGETYTGITSEEETETADTDPEESQTESVTAANRSGKLLINIGKLFTH